MTGKYVNSNHSSQLAENEDSKHEDELDEEADKLQAEETVLNNHLECVK